MNREFVMKAHVYNSKKHKIKGWLFSEKMDGNRCIWDGGISRGKAKTDVPWANNDRDARYVTQPRATGLWSSLGNVIHAPDWFLDQLPSHPLDGELFSGRKEWQYLSTVIKRINPDDDAWERVTYNVFDIPPYQMMFAEGKINNPNFVKQIDLAECMNFVRANYKGKLPGFMDFKTVTKYLGTLDLGPNMRAVSQITLEDEDHLNDALRKINDLGGEGLIIRDPRSYWEPKRSHCQVKVKEQNDDEGTVIGYTWGRETDKGSKLLGKMGALIVDYKGQELKVSGFTDSEREMTFINGPLDSRLEGYQFSGQRTSNQWTNEQFPIGTMITFRYRELSDTGIPKECRFWRKRDEK